MTLQAQEKERLAMCGFGMQEWVGVGVVICALRGNGGWDFT